MFLPQQDTRTRSDLPKLDLHVLPLYRLGVTGRGVRVAVLDDGIEYTHDDLRENYVSLYLYTETSYYSVLYSKELNDKLQKRIPCTRQPSRSWFVLPSLEMNKKLREVLMLLTFNAQISYISLCTMSSTIRHWISNLSDKQSD